MQKNGFRFRSIICKKKKKKDYDLLSKHQHCSVCSDWQIPKQDETKRALGVSRQTSGWDYLKGRLQG